MRPQGHQQGETLKDLATQPSCAGKGRFTSGRSTFAGVVPSPVLSLRRGVVRHFFGCHALFPQPELGSPPSPRKPPPSPRSHRDRGSVLTPDRLAGWWLPNPGCSLLTLSPLPGHLRPRPQSQMPAAGRGPTFTTLAWSLFRGDLWLGLQQSAYLSGVSG